MPDDEQLYRVRVREDESPRDGILRSRTLGSTYAADPETAAATVLAEHAPLHEDGFARLLNADVGNDPTEATVTVEPVPPQYDVDLYWDRAYDEVVPAACEQTLADDP